MSIIVCTNLRGPLLPYTPPGHEEDGSCCEGPWEVPHGQPRCVCGPDQTGESPLYRPDCPACNPEAFREPPVPVSGKTEEGN